ncbi:MAG TPA: type II secretion system F family protein [Alphaproteobacteria bacterium]|nr:type II secretion system F family protein [Alphaproteobacteria bacterium]
MNLVASYMNVQFLITLLTFVAALGAIVSIAMPYLQQDRLGDRLKLVSERRDELKAQARSERDSRKSKIRPTASSYMQQVVDRLSLRKILESPETRIALAQAGLRGQAPLITFLFFRLVMPVLVFIGAFVYLLITDNFAGNMTAKLAVSLVAGGIGFYLPNVYLQNLIVKRQQAITRAFPDALDLLLICVEAGMTIEVAFGRVAREIGGSSIELAEELGLTTAELAYLSDRRTALENFAQRTGLEGVKAVVTSLIQSERYGTPLGQTLRVMSQENRDLRMAAAEKKAGALPAQLTIPMIGCFLPVLFLVILGPVAITLMSD